MLAGTAGGAAISLQLNALNRQRTNAERIAECRRDDFEIVDALGIRLLVNAVERCDTFSFQMGGYGLIGRQHEFLDQTMGDIALGPRDALHQSVLIEFNDGFGQIKIDGAAALALLFKMSARSRMSSNCFTSGA